MLAALTSFSDVANTPFSAAIAYVESLGAHLLHSPATQPGLHMPVATAAFMPSPVLQQLSISGGYNAAAQSANSVGQFNFPAATAPFAPGQTSAQVSPACLVSARGQPDVCGCLMLTGLNMLPGRGSALSGFAEVKRLAPSIKLKCCLHTAALALLPLRPVLLLWSSNSDRPQAACRTTPLRQCWPCYGEPARPSSSSDCTS